MDFGSLLGEFIDELLGLHSAYAITDIDQFGGNGDAAAVVRLRVRLCDQLIAEGWAPTAEAAAALDRDRQLLLETDDEDVTPAAPVREGDRTGLRAWHVPAESDRVRLEVGRPRDEAREIRQELEQMRQALASRAVIEQAKGIAMERYGLRPEVAWSWLVRTSQNRNVKLRALAQEIVEAIGKPSPAQVSARPGSESVASAATPSG